MWFAGSVLSLMAYLFARLYLGSLTNSALATTDPAELVRLGDLIEGAVLLVDVAFFLFIFLLVVTVGLLVYADGGPRQRGPRELTRDRWEENQRRLLEANVYARREREAREREAREKEERP